MTDVTTPRRRGRPAGLQGAELLAVARGTLVELGLGGTTMSEVATRAGISKASLYREHDSKDALFAAVVLDWTAQGRDSMRPALDAILAASDVTAGLTELESSPFEYRDMVFPRRIANPHLRAREVAFQEISADFQGAGAAQRLSGGHAMFRQYRMIGTEQQRRDSVTVGVQSFHRQID